MNRCFCYVMYINTFRPLNKFIAKMLISAQLTSHVRVSENSNKYYLYGFESLFLLFETLFVR
jgi:hypothetical protein